MQTTTHDFVLAGMFERLKGQTLKGRKGITASPKFPVALSSTAIDSVIIRRIKLGDERALVEFYNGLSESSKRTFRPIDYTTTIDVCEKIIKDNNPETEKKFDLVAIHETRIVGWGFLWNLESGEPTFGLGVADDCQGKGLGSRLIDSVMATARERGFKKVFLTVVQGNEVAWKLYEKRGFVKYGEFVGKDGLDYFRMVAALDLSQKVSKN